MTQDKRPSLPEEGTGTDPPRLPEQPIDRLVEPFARFTRLEASGGVVLLVAAVIALVLANSPFAETYQTMITTELGFSLGAFEVTHTLQHWVNDGLLTIFFFVVGLEIKREIVNGELSAPRRAALPIAAALGGMGVPAAIYLTMTFGSEASSGWGIVMATDIAFVVNALALLGGRVPLALRVFVLALAIIDDIGAVIVIALGYSHSVDFDFIALAVAGLGVIAVMRWLGIRALTPFWAAGILVWAAMSGSGVHPTLTGVAIAMITPIGPRMHASRLRRFLRWSRERMRRSDDTQTEDAAGAVGREMSKAAVESVALEQRLESALHPWSSYVVLPLFALTNAGISLGGGTGFEPVNLAVICGLFVGKPLGIVGFSWIAVRSGLADLPDNVTWPMVFGAGILAGIGFTMSIFISGLAFGGDLLAQAKLGVLTASLLSALAGFGFLYAVLPKQHST